MSVPQLPVQRPEIFQPPADCSEAIAHHLRDWEWEAVRAGGKLHLFCYLGDGVIALAPFDFTD